MSQCSCSQTGVLKLDRCHCRTRNPLSPPQHLGTSRSPLSPWGTLGFCTLVLLSPSVTSAAMFLFPGPCSQSSLTPPFQLTPTKTSDAEVCPADSCLPPFPTILLPPSHHHCLLLPFLPLSPKPLTFLYLCPFASLLTGPGTYRQLASSSISPLKQPVPCPSISVLVRALGVSPSALFSAKLGRSPLRLHRARLGVLLCLKVTFTDPFPSVRPHHTHSGLGAVVLKSSPPYLTPCLLSLC